MQTTYGSATFRGKKIPVTVVERSEDPRWQGADEPTAPYPGTTYVGRTYSAGQSEWAAQARATQEYLRTRDTHPGPETTATPRQARRFNLGFAARRIGAVLALAGGFVAAAASGYELADRHDESRAAAFAEATNEKTMTPHHCGVLLAHEKDGAMTVTSTTYADSDKQMALNKDYDSLLANREVRTGSMSAESYTLTDTDGDTQHVSVEYGNYKSDIADDGHPEITSWQTFSLNPDMGTIASISAVTGNVQVYGNGMDREATAVVDAVNPCTIYGQ